MGQDKESGKPGQSLVITTPLLRRSKGTPLTAQKVEAHLEDDLDGSPAEHTVTFVLDGKDHEIDLSTASTGKLREALRPYAAAGRQATRTSGSRGTESTRSSNGEPNTAMIRAWAKDNRHPVSDPGHIQQSVTDACYVAH